MNEKNSQRKEDVLARERATKARSLFPESQSDYPIEKAAQSYRRKLYMKGDDAKRAKLEKLAAKQQAARDFKAEKIRTRLETFNEKNSKLTRVERRELIQSLTENRDELLTYLDIQIERLKKPESVSKAWGFQKIKDRLNAKPVETIDFKKELGKIVTNAKEHTNRSFSGAIYGLFFNPTSYNQLKEVVKKDWYGNWRFRK